MTKLQALAALLWIIGYVHDREYASFQVAGNENKHLIIIIFLDKSWIPPIGISLPPKGLLDSGTMGK